MLGRGLLAGLMVAAGAAKAERITEFAPFVHDTTRPGVLRLEGDIDGETPVMMQRALARFDGVTTLELSSYGGTVADALPLAYFLRRLGLRTDIPAGSDCASACSYLFFAGIGRDAGGRLGVHAIAMPSNDLKAGQRALGEIFRAFEEFGVPAAVHTRMMATPAEAMFWFGPEEMVALGLTGHVGATTSDAELRARLRSQLELEARLPEWVGPPAGVTPGQLATVEQQRRIVAEAPADPVARETLAGYEAGLGNFRAARVHQAEAITLRAGTATVADYTLLAYYLVAAADGVVSSDAETAVRRALSGDRNDGIALYYLGLMYGQNDRADVALAIWRDLLARSGPGDAWYGPVRAQIGQLADAAGVAYSLPPEAAPAAVAPTPVQPTVSQPAAPPATQPAAPGGTDAAPGGTPRATPGGYGTPSGLAVFAWGLFVQTFGGGSLSGQVSGAPGYTMRIRADGEFLKVDYPELGCGGYWELTGNAGSTAEFLETLTYGQSACSGGASIVASEAGGGWNVTVNGPAGGGGAASVNLR